MTLLIVVIVIVAVLALIVWPSVKIVKQWERGILLRFGRFKGARKPGLNFMLPWIDRMVIVDTRVETMVVEPQEVITNDNVTVSVDAVVYFQVVNAEDHFTGITSLHLLAVDTQPDIECRNILNFIWRHEPRSSWPGPARSSHWHS